MFSSKNVKNISFLSENFQIFGGEIFYIFEVVCFRNDLGLFNMELYSYRTKLTLCKFEQNHTVYMQTCFRIIVNKSTFLTIIYSPRHRKSTVLAYANRNGIGKPVLPRSLVKLLVKLQPNN